MTDVEDEEGQPIAPRKWSWPQLAAIATNFLGNILICGGGACHEASEAITAHALYRQDRAQFARSVLADIDALPTTEPTDT